MSDSSSKSRNRLLKSRLIDYPTACTAREAGIDIEWFEPAIAALPKIASPDQAWNTAMEMLAHTP